MDHIAAMDDGKIPRDDDFNFRTRAKNLVNNWRSMIGKPTASTSGHASSSRATSSRAPTSRTTSNHECTSGHADGRVETGFYFQIC